MKALHSIRWRLQVWHGAVLAIVLIGFGATIWHLQEASAYQRIDRELEQRVAAVAGAVRDGSDPFDRRPPTRTGDAGRRPPRGAGGVATTDSELYYVAWAADGRLLQQSVSAPANVPRPDRTSEQRSQRLRGSVREFVFFTPQGDCILIGRDIADELQAMRRFLWLLVVAGSTVFVLGLAGGWWASSRALKPIAHISDTATRIAAGDLSQRIPTPEAGSELADLADVLNTAFARIQDGFARQTRFTADASHELRTPVAVVLTQTQSALARERSIDEYRESLAACERAAHRMAGLIESLLTLARLDAGTASERSACDLGRVVLDAVDLVRPLAMQQDITIDAHCDTARCFANAPELGQVATNILANAITYSAPGGRVHITTAVTGEAATLTVTDTGIGIAPEHLPHIFDRFYRVDGVRTSSRGRSGLGLAITKAIVDAHGGSIQATSTLGRGTQMVVTFPRLTPAV